MNAYCTKRAGSHITSVHQAVGEFGLLLYRLLDKEITAQPPEVSHLHILEVG